MVVELIEVEKSLPYVKFFYQEMAPIPEEKLEIWKGEAAPAEAALPVEERGRFLDEEPPTIENGFCVAPNGTGFVANSTFMPNVEPEMLDWWFAWHSVTSDLRYKVWDPEDHYHARALDPEYVLDPSVPVREKTWGVNHDILEDVGFGPERILLQFKKPSDLGFDMDKIGKPGCAGMVCACGVGDSPALMTHKWMKVDGGVMFKSHFWMGYGFNENSELVKVIPDGVSIPEAGPRALYGHNIKEYSNLAAILPEIYAHEKDNW